VGAIQRTFRFDKPMLLAFLAWDAIAIAIHTAYGLAVHGNPQLNWPDFFNIGRDWSAGELGNYVKWSLIVFALFLAYSRVRAPGYLALAVVFLICLLDDSLQFHERGATALISLSLISDTYGQAQGEIGELIVWSVLGAICVGIMGWGWAASNANERRKIWPALILFLGIFFCAVILDVLHTVVVIRSMIAGLLGLAEDGGEMVVLTLLLSYIWAVFYRDAVTKSARELPRHQNSAV